MCFNSSGDEFRWCRPTTANIAQALVKDLVFLTRGYYKEDWLDKFTPTKTPDRCRKTDSLENGKGLSWHDKTRKLSSRARRIAPSPISPRNLALRGNSCWHSQTH